MGWLLLLGSYWDAFFSESATKMNVILNLVFIFIQNFFIKKALKGVQQKGLLIYLNALQVARKSTIGAVFIISVLQIMVWGLCGSIGAGVFLLPYDLETKIWLLFGISLGLFLIPALILIYVLSEKVWYKASGAEKIVTSLKS